MSELKIWSIFRKSRSRLCRFLINLKKGEENSLFKHCVYKMKVVASSASVHSLYVKYSSKEIVVSNSSIHKSVSDIWIG